MPRNQAPALTFGTLHGDHPGEQQLWYRRGPEMQGRGNEQEEGQEEVSAVAPQQRASLVQPER